jgi:FkbM family methyltransferase
VIRRLLERWGLLIHVKKVYYAAETRVHLSRNAALFSHVCPRGGLVFDVGANLGQKTAIFVSLGARVVSIEPERRCCEYLRKRFGASDRVTVVNVAVSDEPGRLELFVNPQTPEISTLDRAWLTDGPDKDKAGQVEAQSVDVVTLTQLIERFGVPDYVKLDVEGFESKVLRGLKVPVGNLSFEFHADNVGEVAERCGIVDALGRYTYNFTRANTGTLALPSWVTAEELCAAIRATAPGLDRWGDVFARRASERL